MHGFPLSKLSVQILQVEAGLQSCVAPVKQGLFGFVAERFLGDLLMNGGVTETPLSVRPVLPTSKGSFYKFKKFGKNVRIT